MLSLAVGCLDHHDHLVVPPGYAAMLHGTPVVYCSVDHVLLPGQECRVALPLALGLGPTALHLLGLQGQARLGFVCLPSRLRLFALFKSKTRTTLRCRRPCRASLALSSD